MRIKEGIVIQKIEDEFVLIDSGVVEPAFHGMIKLNESSKLIIDLLTKKDMSEDELVQELLKIYDEKPEVIAKAVKEFIKELGTTPVLIK